jgi:integrase
MSRQPHVPSYRKHKQSGQAIVTLTDVAGNRRDVLLGKHGTSESRTEYARVIAEWEAAGRRLSTAAAKHMELTINELILAYWRFAEGYYRKNGEPTKQQYRVKQSMKAVKDIYGHTPVKDFGPLALKAVRESLVKADWTRGYVNSCIGCIKRMFKWAVENELAPPSLYHGLAAVAGLKKGRSDARETKPIRPVPQEHVEAVLPVLTRAVRAMVQVQQLAGMRPCEVTIMRPCDIDRATGKTWIYRPESHKTEHHDIARVIFLGPQAQEILGPFLDRDPGAYMFCPREMMLEFRAEQRKARKTKVQPSQFDRKKPRKKQQPGLRYSVDSYRRAIDAACDKLGVPHWHPNQLRHTKATEIRREAGLDAARAVLGHRSSAITETYAEIDMHKAAAVMEKLG